MAKIDLLERWRNEMMLLSSELQIKGPLVDRKFVEFVYHNLKNTFGSKFFLTQDGSVQIHDQNWFHQLLVNSKQKGSFLLLLDYVNLILYSKSLGKDFFIQIKKLESNLDNLRSYFFELFTYRLLDLNGIKNEKKTIDGKQEQEGNCEIKQHNCLFECRKLYLPGSEELDVKKYIVSHLVMKLREEFDVGIGILVVLRFKKKLSNKSKTIFKLKIDKFFEKIKTEKGKFWSIDYEEEDQDGIFKVLDYSLHKKIELENDKSCDVFCYLAPPSVIVPDIPNYFAFHISTTFQKEESQITQYLLQKIKEKKRQHTNSVLTKKIFFFDNEVFPQIRMSLFPEVQNNLGINEKMIQQYISDSLSEIILCIVDRNYTYTIPKIKLKVFSKPKHSDIKTALENFIFN